MRYLLFLLYGAGVASLYWLHFTGHDDPKSDIALVAAVILTFAGIALTMALAYEERKL